MSFSTIPFCKSKDDIKGNYGPVKEKIKQSCLFPFFSPLIAFIEKDCQCGLPRISDSDTACEYRPFLSLGLIFIYVSNKLTFNDMEVGAVIF